MSLKRLMCMEVAPPHTGQAYTREEGIFALDRISSSLLSMSHDIFLSDSTFLEASDKLLD